MDSPQTANNVSAYVHVSFLKNGIKLDGHEGSHVIDCWFNEKEGYEPPLDFFKSLSTKGEILVHLEQSLGVESSWMVRQLQQFPNVSVI